jgi:hypothetical protein
VFSVRSVVRLPTVLQAAQILEHSSTEFGKQFLDNSNPVSAPSVPLRCVFFEFARRARWTERGALLASRTRFL